MSTRGPKRPPALTPEESRFLDGTLPPEEAKRLEREIAADPARSDALASYRRAVGLWRDDAERGAVAPEQIADKVLAAVGRGEAGGAAGIPTWYAVAAMLMISVGVLGTAFSQNLRPKRVLPPASSIQGTLIETLVDEHFMAPEDFVAPADEEGR
ncbi:MAG: hypothetical protein QNJ98_07675 [Planctomycetota bacterium]|nr:hypothetical protein [Planctomycetota bacterium]